MFNLDRVPESLILVGGGAAREMAQSFSRLGSTCTMIIRAPHLLRGVDADAVQLLEHTFQQEGIEILSSKTIQHVLSFNDGVKVLTDDGEILVAEKLIIATGRRMDFSGLALENSGCRHTPGHDRDRQLPLTPSIQTRFPHVCCPLDNFYRTADLTYL